MKSFNGILLATFVAIQLVEYSEGINCWICYQASSNRDCIMRGHAKTCRSQEGCENEVRYSGHKIIITKRCKQLQACSNEQYQNTQISNNKYQCGAGRQNSVCRCCCKTNFCNKNQLSCIDEGAPKCRFLFLPNGSTRCFGSADGISLHTQCQFNCRAGYQVKGAKSVTCMKRGSLASWSAPTPKCRKRPTCARLYSHSIANGFVRCTGTTGIATVGTSCVFRCNPRYLLVNEKKRKGVTNFERTVCTLRRDVPTWSRKPPACIEELCPVATNIDHGVATCSNFNKVGSVCEFSCFAGYDLIGETTIKCMQRAGVKDWDIRPPICQPKPCPINTFSKPLLRRECSHFNQFGSICSITCAKGYYTVDPATALPTSDYTPTCVLDGAGGVAWSKPAPNCSPKSCPAAKKTKEEVFRCTAGTKYMSRCTLRCESPVHEVAGQRTITCVDDGKRESTEGVWNAPNPTCQYKKCSPINSDTTDISCDNGFVYKSTCQFSCKEGFHMLARDGLTITKSKKAMKTTCSFIDGEVLWSNSPPKCEMKRCPEIMQPESGRMTCSDTNTIGSQCSITCLDGFEMAGKSSFECKEWRKNKIMGRWTSPPPICKRRSCANIYYDKVSSDLTCTDEFKFESACTLGCNGGYYMRKAPGTPVLDRVKTTCLYSATGMTWSERTITCQPKTCDAIEAIPNGKMRCSKELIYSARCDFSCDRGYDLRGSARATCEDSDSVSSKGQWSSPAPSCEPRKCGALEFDRESMTAECDMGLDYKSRCTFSCKPMHFMKNPQTGNNIRFSTSTCKLGENDQPYWDPQPKPCEPVTCKSVNDPAIYVSCTNGNKPKSRCTFSCPIGYDLIGNVTNKCDPIGQYDAKWKHPLAFCKVRTCISLVTDEDVNKTCSLGTDYKSECSFMCQQGRGLFMTEGKNARIVKDGVSVAKCNIDQRGNMYWTGNLPKCHIKYCLVRRNPKGGRVKCSDGSKYQSICTYACNPGYRRVGPRTIICEEGKPNSPQGKWNSNPPTCRRR